MAEKEQDELVAELRSELRSLTVEQLAQATGIEPWRIYQMIKKGEAPPSFRVGRTYRFPVAGVRSWFAEQTKARAS
jgi:excisionase family DNA binding protein